MKKIAIFALDLSSGGIERYTSNLCKMLENDYEIELISTFKKSKKPMFNFSKKIKIKYLIEDDLYEVSIKKLLSKFKYISVLKEFFKRKKIKYLARKRNINVIKNLQTDYIITTRVYHSELVNKYLNNDKVIKIASEHNYHNNDQKYIKKFIKSVSSFDYVVHCTTELYLFYKDKIKQSKNVFIPNMIEINNNSKSNLKYKNIISVGRLSPEKGYLDLVDVMNLVHKNDKDIILTICGDGEEKELLINKIKKLKLDDNIILRGFVTGYNLEKEYLKASLYVMPSLSEAFGFVLLEAMHFGLPCISFDSASGAKYLLKDNVGIIINDRDKEVMAQKIIELLNNKELLKKYQLMSLNKVKQYQISKIYKEWKKILN